MLHPVHQTDKIIRKAQILKNRFRLKNLPNVIQVLNLLKKEKLKKYFTGKIEFIHFLNFSCWVVITLASSFKLWPEDSIPKSVYLQEFDTLANHGTRLVWGEGNHSAPIMIILDNPGARETVDGEPLVCGTRIALYSAIQKAGLSFSLFYLTYLLKRRPVKAYDRSRAQASYLPLLHQQINEISPDVLVLLGNTVAKAFIGPDAEVKNLRGKILTGEIPQIISYHPLATRRRPQLFSLLVSDISLVKDLFKQDDF